MAKSFPLLYKYHKNNKYLYDLLIENSFYMASSKELNDIFDCGFKVSNGFVFSEIHQSKKVELLVNNLYVKFKVAANNFIRADNSENQKLVITSIKELKEMGVIEVPNFRVCCFSEDFINDQLWAYYSNSFSGVCLEFDFRKNTLMKSKFRKVRYTNDIVNINSKSDFEEVPFHKNLAYKEEKEWRIFYPNDKYDMEKFNLLELKKIYFGSRMDYKDIHRIITLTQRLGYNIEYFGMNPLFDEKRYEFEKLKPKPFKK